MCGIEERNAEIIWPQLKLIAQGRSRELVVLPEVGNRDRVSIKTTYGSLEYSSPKQQHANMFRDRSAAAISGVSHPQCRGALLREAPVRMGGSRGPKPILFITQANPMPVSGSTNPNEPPAPGVPSIVRRSKDGFSSSPLRERHNRARVATGRAIDQVEIGSVCGSRPKTCVAADFPFRACAPRLVSLSG